MDEQNKNIVGWFTSKTGRHIPIMKGETRDQAMKRVFGEAPKLKKKEETKASDDKSKSQAPKKAVKETDSEQKSVKKQPKSVSKDTRKKETKSVEKKTTNIADSNKKETAEKEVKRTPNTVRREDIERVKERDRLNAEQKYQNSLRMGNKVGTKDGHLVFKGKDVEPLDTSEAGKNDSLGNNIDKNGNLTPQRLKVHQKIVEEYFGDHKPYAPGQEKKCLFTGGGGASGKGVFSREIAKYYSSNDDPLIVDPDNIKKKLAAADGVKLTMENTPYYHEESSALAKQIYQMAMDNNYPMLYDGTATGGGIYKLLKTANKKGYKTEMNFIFSDYNTVLKNSIGRYDNSERLVPLRQQLKAHKNAYDAVERLNDQFDSFTLWDNRKRGMHKVATNTKGNKMQFDKSEKNYDSEQAYKEFANAKDEFKFTGDRSLQFWGAVAAVDRYNGRDVNSVMERVLRDLDEEVKERKKQQSGSGGK